MASKTTIVLTHDKETTADLKNKFQFSTLMPKKQMANLLKLFQEIAMGRRMASMIVTIDDGDGVQATGTVTLSSFAADDTVTIAGQVFTAKVSPSGANQFALGADDTAAAAALAAKVNAHTSLTGVCTATSALGVVTVTAAIVGLIGNRIGLAISAHGSVSAATLASGTNSANSTTNSGYLFGKTS